MVVAMTFNVSPVTPRIVPPPPPLLTLLKNTLPHLRLKVQLNPTACLFWGKCVIYLKDLAFSFTLHFNIVASTARS